MATENKNGEHVLNEEPDYRLEIYSWNGSTAVRAFSSDGVSTMQEKSDESRFYILQRMMKKHIFAATAILTANQAPVFGTAQAV